VGLNPVYPFRMKSKFVVKFLLALAFGAAVGQRVHMDQEKWHRLGREAFLAYQANQFDHNMMAPAVGLMVFCAIFALGLGALYEGLAFAGVKLISRISPEESLGPGVSSKTEEQSPLSPPAP
jgi:hypothetical protein